MLTEEERAGIYRNPNLPLAEKMRLLDVKDASAFRALSSNLPAVPRHTADIPAKGAAQFWNPPREHGYGSYRDTLYAFRTDTLKKRFAFCRDYAGNKGIGFLQSGVKLEAAFACTGFTHISDAKKAKNYFDKFGALFNIRHKLYEMFKSLKTYDNIVVYWRKPPDDIYGKTFLDFKVQPLQSVAVDYVGAINETTHDGNLVYLDIDTEHKERIKRLARSSKANERKIAQDFKNQFPKLWKVYQSYGDDKYLLSNADGEFWAVINREKGGCGLDEPSMEGIFPSIEIWKSLEEGDLVIASVIKKLIVLVTLGETLSNNDTVPGFLGITDLPNAGWAREKDFGDIKNALARRFGQILYLFAPHHAKIDYKFPDPQVLGSEKYTHALYNILSWLCIGQQFITGDGGKFQAGEINKISLTADLDNMRDFVATEFAEKVYAHPTININRYEVPDIQFDRDVLKAPREIRDDVKLDVQLGLSLIEALKRRGYDLKHSMALRKFEREEWRDLLVNLVDFTGNVDIPAAGRPPDGDPSDLDNPPRREEEK